MTIYTRLFLAWAAFPVIAGGCGDLLGTTPSKSEPAGSQATGGSSGAGGSGSSGESMRAGTSGSTGGNSGGGGSAAGGAGGGGSNNSGGSRGNNNSDGSGPTGMTTTDAGPSGGDTEPSGECAYPTAPAYTSSTFKIGTVMPNLTFTREDGSSFSMKDVYCNKKNRLLFWTTGGDNCGPCVGAAQQVEIPAAKELGPSGLFMLESFNGAGFLVTQPPGSPWVNWRRQTKWPPDGDSIAVVKEPSTKPYYLQDRVNSILPWSALVDVATMKILSANDSPTVAAVRSRLMNLPPRQ